MVKLIEFIRDYLDLRRESKSYCKTCDLLREQLARETVEKNKLLEKFVFITPQTPVTIENKLPEPIPPRGPIPWKIQRELLESEDRAKAATMRRQREDFEAAAKLKVKEGPIENSSISIDELERELEIGEK